MSVTIFPAPPKDFDPITASPQALVVCVVNSNYYPRNNVSTIERFSDARCSPDSSDF